MGPSIRWRLAERNAKMGRVDPGTAYLEIALRLRKLAPWLVESYAGPSELVARIDAESLVQPGELRKQVRLLADTVHKHDFGKDRRAWLCAQLAGLDTALGFLDGEQFSYRQLVERCHGITPTFVPESVFADAHDQLRDALPGSGDLRGRYQRAMASQHVAPERLLEGLR